eukprot:scaffold250849_cov27-Tisochrysis_lutea.AAC.4
MGHRCGRRQPDAQASLNLLCVHFRGAITSVCPSTAACMKAETPSELRRLMSAPAARRRSTRGREPLEAAAMSAVMADLSSCNASTSCASGCRRNGMTMHIRPHGRAAQ